MNSPQATVSIIVPIYNPGPYLHACIDSALGQTYRNIELILVDDGSTDGSSAVIDRYAASDSRVTTLRQSNRGLSAARNAGLDIAQGDFITFLDADDILHPRFTELLTEQLNAGADIAACDFTRRETELTDAVSNQEQISMSGHDALESMLYQTSRLRHSAWGKIYRRALWNGLRYPDCWFEDLHISADLFPKATILTFIPAKLYFYRDNPDGFMARKDGSRFDAVKAAINVWAITSSISGALQRAATDRILSAALNFLVMAVRHRIPVSAKNMELCISLIKLHRKNTLLNPLCRRKNRLGALASYLGVLPVLKLACRRSGK